MQALAIGPWVVAIGLIALVLGWLAANGVAWFAKRRWHVDVGTPLWVLLMAALVVARAAFVLAGWSAYRTAPWSMLDVRDGGFAWPVGVAVLVLGTLAWMWRRPGVRRALPASVGAGLAVWALVGLVAWGLRPPTQPPLPDYTLQTLTGRDVPLATLEGKPMVVNIWATWCGPCRAELPMLVAASRRMRDVRFVFVDHGESAATVRGYLASAGLDPAHVLLDTEGRLMQHYKLPGCPSTLFVAPSGQVRDLHVGMLSLAALQQALRGLAGVARVAQAGAAPGAVRVASRSSAASRVTPGPA
ncbi:MAG TPA: TlpA disulfide reductase family protein [Rhodanobacteraceae bacterium]|nr:TlpA disulfide reductase family protein [Rhodanobacteraceae bacterium]